MGNDYNLKQFNPRRRSRKSMEPLSGGKTALVVVGIFVLALFLGSKFITKWNGTQEEAITLAYSEYYYPSETTELYAAKKLMNAMNAAQKLSCPTTELKTAFNVIDTPSTSQAKKTALYELTTKGYLDKVTDVVDSAFSGKSAVTRIIDLYQFSEDNSSMYYPIVAPFDFTFISSNTDTTGIQIQNKDGNAKIIITQELCWFCGMTGSEVEYESLVTHKSHGSIVGASSNSIITGGSAGSIIGFGGQNTKAEFLKRDDKGEWSRVSWEDFCK